jgi:hypothetical protein
VLDWLQWTEEGGVHNVANVDWVLDWLQRTGEGGVHNVAYKITKGLKCKIRLPRMNLCNSFKIDYVLLPHFRPSSNILLRNITTVHWTCQHTNYIPLFTVTFTRNSRYPSIWLSANWICVYWFITLYIVTITVSTAGYSCILYCLYTLQQYIIM